MENSSEIGERKEGQADADADIKAKAAPSTKSSDVRSASVDSAGSKRSKKKDRCANRNCCEVPVTPAKWTEEQERELAVGWQHKIEKDRSSTHQSKMDGIQLMVTNVCSDLNGHFSHDQVDNKIKQMQRKFNKVEQIVSKGTGGGGKGVVAKACHDCGLQVACYNSISQFIDHGDKQKPALRYDSGTSRPFFIKSEIGVDDEDNDDDDDDDEDNNDADDDNGMGTDSEEEPTDKKKQKERRNLGKKTQETTTIQKSKLVQELNNREPQRSTGKEDNSVPGCSYSKPSSTTQPRKREYLVKKNPRPTLASLDEEQRNRIARKKGNAQETRATVKRDANTVSETLSQIKEHAQKTNAKLWGMAPSEGVELKKLDVEIEKHKLTISKDIEIERMRIDLEKKKEDTVQLNLQVQLQQAKNAEIRLQITLQEQRNLEPAW